MSQRSAFTAAATATADRSDPPRPSVVTRLRSGLDALEARDHRHLAGLHALDQQRAVDALDARLAMRVVGHDRHLPALPGPRLDADGLQRDGQQADRHLLAGGDDHVVFARVVQRRELLSTT